MTHGFHMQYLAAAIFMLLIILSALTTVNAQRIRVEGGIKSNTETPATDSIAVEVAEDGASAESREIKPAVVADKARDKAIKADSVRPRFRLTQDTMSAGKFTVISFIPGLGQIYNRQAWKVPVFYAAIGGFATAGALFSKSYNDHKAEYNRSLDMNLPREMTEQAQKRMQRAGSARTLMYSMAAVTYLYSVADATLNYRGVNNRIRKATTLAAVFPGMGFVYTRSYWRLPIYYGGFVALGTVIDYNNRQYQRYRRAYLAKARGEQDEFNGRYSEDVLLNIRNSYRRDRDFAIIATAAAYIVSVIDTHVIASLKNWDVSDDLGFRIEPAIIDNSIQRASIVPKGYGMSVTIRF